MSTAARTAFVTGGTGFVGSHLIEGLLARGLHVRALVRPATARPVGPEGSPGRLEWIEGDLAGAGPGTDRLARAMAGCETLFHVAGVVSARHAEAYGRVNVEGAARAAKAAADAGVRRILLVSSQAAAGPNPNHRPRVEEDPETPVSAYGRSKLAGERETMRIGEERGVEVVVVRPPAVYGPRDRAFLLLFRMADRGVLFLHQGASRQIVSVIHVDDLVQGMILAEAGAPAGRTYYLTDGTAHSAAELAAAISRALAKRPLRVIIPDMALRIVAGGSELVGRWSRRAPVLTRERILQWTRPYWTLSDERARRELGYSPRVDLDAGLEATARWYRTAGWL